MEPVRAIERLQKSIGLRRTWSIHLFKIITRWAPTSYKWRYNPRKWPYTLITGVVTLLSGVKTLVLTGDGAHLEVLQLIWSIETVSITLPETNSKRPWKQAFCPIQKERIILQAYIFRGFRCSSLGRVLKGSPQWMDTWLIASWWSFSSPNWGCGTPSKWPFHGL